MVQGCTNIPSLLPAVHADFFLQRPACLLQLSSFAMDQQLACQACAGKMAQNTRI